MCDEERTELLGLATGTVVEMQLAAFSERALRCMCWHPVGHLYLCSLRVNTYHIAHTPPAEMPPGQ